MGWWEDLGNWAGELTGWNAAQRQRDSDEKERRAAEEREKRMLKLTQGFTGDASQMGQQAMAFAQQQAGQQANMQATEAARQAGRAARTAGLNPGQAAVLGGQTTAGTWAQAQQAALNQALQLYNTQQNANLSAAGLNPFQGPQYTNQGAGQQAMEFGKGVVGGVSGFAGTASNVQSGSGNTGLGG